MSDANNSPQDAAKSVIEGVLFAMGRSVSVTELASALGETRENTRRLADSLASDMADANRGIRIIRLEDSYQMCTAKSCYEPLIRIISAPRRPRLTEVVMETLAIIAYRQPVTKVQIEKIRGVSSDHAINRLVEYGLVCEMGRMDAPGRPILFGTTEEFLRRFELEGLDSLPIPPADDMEELKEEAADVGRQLGILQSADELS